MKGLYRGSQSAPDPAKPVEAQRIWAKKLFVVQHHLLDNAAKLPRLVEGIKKVRRNNDFETLLLGGGKQAGEVFDGVVFFDAVANQFPGDALLAQDIVLRVDDN